MVRLTLFYLYASLALASSRQTQNKEPRIIHGEEATPGQFPWQAALIVEGEGPGWFCSGCIISEEWIVTAGHCVEGANAIYINTGGLGPANGTDNFGSEFVFHPNYNYPLNDIVLIKVESSIVLENFTSAISLSSDSLSEGENITVSGWGHTTDTGLDLSPTLKYVSLVTITKEECSEAYTNYQFPEEDACAKSDSTVEKGICFGDGGDPVVKNLDSDPVLVAIASFHPVLGCSAHIPAGYIQIANYRDWIQETAGV